MGHPSIQRAPTTHRVIALHRGLRTQLMIDVMTQARSQLVPPGSPGSLHCVQRCVRRAFLCGIDQYTGRSFEHRKIWVEERIHLVAECFAVAIQAYAVMSNHLHLVLQMDPAHIAAWSDIEVAEHWIRLFPPREDSDLARTIKCERLLADKDRLILIRSRLGSLSWLMRCLVEPIARRANLEDGCTGRFWEGRFKSQLLCDDRAILAAMAYVDLNPIRAGITRRLDRSQHTSIQSRIAFTRRNPETLHTALTPLAGCIATHLPINTADYLALVEWAGRQLRPGKRGSIPKDAPSCLHAIEQHPHRWAIRVKSVGSGYWRVIGEFQDMVSIAERLGQHWLKGIKLAASLT